MRDISIEIYGSFKANKCQEAKNNGKCLGNSGNSAESWSEYQVIEIIKTDVKCTNLLWGALL